MKCKGFSFVAKVSCFDNFISRSSLRNLTIFFAFFLVNSSGLILECNFGDVTWSIAGAVYTCTGTLTEDGDEWGVRTVEGNHTADRIDRDVLALAISGQPLPNGIPANINSFFPNLTVLSFSNTQIPRISRYDLERFPNLHVLIMFNNHLEALNSDLFVSTPLIEYVNLSSNRLRNLGTGIFDRLSNLKTLRLLNNVCINQFVDNNETELVSLRWEANFRCPQSLLQLEEALFSGEYFLNVVGPMQEQLWYLENRVIALETLLESQNKN